MTVKNVLLKADEFYNEIFEKDTIYIHHTAGSHRPDWVVNSWEHDKTQAGLTLKVATSYIIGGVSTRDLTDVTWDGVIVKTFEDKYWAHHLGTTGANNSILNKKSIGIEICNYGPLVLGKDGQYFNYVNSPVPANMVVKLNKPFRGYTYYHAYTEKQIAALKELFLDIIKRHPKINLKKGLREDIANPDFLELNQAALKGYPGVWSHSNVRKDKFDVYPHPQLIALLHSL
jgi:N-acetyl-anhydromuramyl-L-alanine amidase AmpD